MEKKSNKEIVAQNSKALAPGMISDADEMYETDNDFPFLEFPPTDPTSVTNQQNCIAKIDALLSNSQFLSLKAKLNNSRNLFKTLAVSHRELWHSAFVKWILDPQSPTGLGSFPIKRFLFLALQNSSGNSVPLCIGDVENMLLENLVFERERTIYLPDEGDSRRIDVIAESPCSVFKTTEKPKRIQIIIENKINASETNDQTDAYAVWSELDENSDFDYKFLIFLTPEASQNPKSNCFVKITYQQFFDKVLRPCLNHPQLTAESRYWLEQYLLNLGDKNPKPMANTNEETCRKIYNAHKEILDEIFMCVRQERPRAETETISRQRYDVTLLDLLNSGKLQKTDTLHADYNGKSYTASLLQTEESSPVLIVYGGTEYPTPSAAGSAVRENRATNGWDFWEVKDESGRSKGSLKEIRQSLVL